MIDDKICNICKSSLRFGERNKIYLKKVKKSSIIKYEYQLCWYHQERVMQFIEKMIDEAK